MALEALSPARRVVVLGHGPLAQEICARLPGVAEPARLKRLERTLTAGDVDCVLAVGPDHEDNLRAAIHASRTAPGVPVITARSIPSSRTRSSASATAGSTCAGRSASRISPRPRSSPARCCTTTSRAG
jgi:hypothetical protein